MGTVYDRPDASQIGFPAALSHIVSVADPVSRFGTFPANFADASHVDTSRDFENR